MNLALFEACQKTLKNSHSPYSKFQVAAAVQMQNGKIYSGCNIENASFGATVCAERVAIWKAVSEGHTSFSDIMILTPTPKTTPPCGMCLQVMSEFFTATTKIHLATDQGLHEEHLFERLFPLRFQFK